MLKRIISYVLCFLGIGIYWFGCQRPPEASKLDQPEVQEKSIDELFPDSGCAPVDQETEKIPCEDEK